MRVVSLLPSATEIVCLVAEHAAAANGSSGDGATPALELVGRSHECDFPASLSHLPMLTAAKTKWTDSAGGAYSLVSGKARFAELASPV